MTVEERACVRFGPLLQRLRIACGISQNALARRAGCDPAYVNRLERDLDGTGPIPSRRVVLGLWGSLDAGVLDRERLLVAAGHAPEVILAAGGWDAYLDLARAGVLAAMREIGLDLADTNR